MLVEEWAAWEEVDISSAAGTPETVHATRDNRNFRVRHARRGDAAAMLQYVKTLFEEPDLSVTFSPGEFNMSLAEEETFIESLRRENSLLLLAVCGDEVIGSAAFEGGKVARTRHAGELGISVARHWRGVGVGTALLKRLLDWAKENPQVERVGLEVFATNPRAKQLYHRFGFKEEGRRLGAIRMSGRLVDSTIMGLLLPPKGS